MGRKRSPEDAVDRAIAAATKAMQKRLAETDADFKARRGNHRRMSLLISIEAWLREIISDEVSAALTRNMTPAEWAADRLRHKGKP